MLINNVRIFNGKDESLAEGMNLRVKKGVIDKISAAAIQDNSGSTVIDGGGRVLMPGMIDVHWHSFLGPNSEEDLIRSEVGFLHLAAGKEAKNTLQRGFTTVRDMGGPSFGLKRAIDADLIPGPRIFPSGAMISQTSGHGDFRFPNEPPRKFGGMLSRWEINGISLIADGVAEVLTASREQLRLGASQIKLMCGGGVGSSYDPLDVVEYSFEETRAAVQAAGDWGTYVACHVYNPAGIRRAVRAGVKSIEHGHLIDEATMQLLADNDVWLSIQPFSIGSDPWDIEPYPPEDSDRNEKLGVVCNGTAKAYALAKKYGVRTAFGTDLLWSRGQCALQTAYVVKLAQLYDHSPFEALRMVTALNGELLALSGPRNPYPRGRLGVIEEGALADLLLIDGNPLRNLALLKEFNQNIKLIVKDGKVFKNTLPRKRME